MEFTSHIVIGCLLLCACGGAGQPAHSQEAPPSTPPPREASASPPAKSGKSLAQHRSEFMEVCAKNAPGLPDYCDCSWQQFFSLFSLDDMNAETPNEAKLAVFKERVGPACVGKLPEEHVKKDFLQGCMSDVPENQAYCDCAWTEYRKHLSVGDMAQEATLTSPRFKAATDKVTRSCAAKMPEAELRKGFMNGCAKDPKLNPYCECGWTTLKKSYSVTQIILGEFDKTKVAKVCRHLLPAGK